RQRGPTRRKETAKRAGLEPPRIEDHGDGLASVLRDLERGVRGVALREVVEVVTNARRGPRVAGVVETLIPEHEPEMSRRVRVVRVHSGHEQIEAIVEIAA